MLWELRGERVKCPLASLDLRICVNLVESSSCLGTIWRCGVLYQKLSAACDKVVFAAEDMNCHGLTFSVESLVIILDERTLGVELKWNLMMSYFRSAVMGICDKVALCTGIANCYMVMTSNAVSKDIYSVWPSTWETLKNQGIWKWSGKSRGKWKKSGKSNS